MIAGLLNAINPFPLSWRSNVCNEMPYTDAKGELKRIDRLVEFDDEVWVLDYKTGESANPAPHHAQMNAYRSAMQAVYPGKTVRCALLFSDGVLRSVGRMPIEGDPFPTRAVCRKIL